MLSNLWRELAARAKRAPRPAARLGRARELYAARLWNAAEREVREFLRADRPSVTDEAAGRILLAECLIQRGDSQGAKEISVALGKAPGVFPPHLQALGTLCFHLGLLAEAEDHFTAATKSFPDSAAAFFGLSATLHRMRRTHEAAVMGMRALALDPALPNLTSALCVIFDELSRSPDTASSDDFITQFAAGNDSLRSGDLAAAEEAYRRSYELHGGWPLTAQRLGCLCAVRGAHEEADRWFQRSAAAGMTPDTNIRLSADFIAALPPAPQSNAPDPLVATGPVAFLHCDAAYFRRFAPAIVSSAIANGTTGVLWHFHVVNPDAWTRQEFDEVAERFPTHAMRLTTETRDFPSPQQAKTYYACGRFVMLPQLVRAYGKPVVLLDLDLLVLHPLQRLIEAHQGADVALVRWSDTDWRLWDQFWASVVVAYPGDAALRFLDCAAAYVAYFLSSGGSAWFLDQIALYAADVHLRRNAVPPVVARIPPQRCAVRHVAGDTTPAADVAFWSVSFNIESNAAGLESALFRQYLPRRRSVFGWQLPGTDLVFQQYLAGAPVYKGRRMWDFGEMQACLARLRLRRRAVDVGAHAGFWSFWLADQFAAVEAFEPQPLLQECFEANVPQPNVRLHRCALGASAGTVDIAADPVNSGMSHIVDGSAGGSIELRALDEWAFGDVDFLKIDAEGFEAAVLQGAGRTLVRCRPLILIEQDERWARRYGHAPRAALACLEGLGAHVVAEFAESNYLVAWSDTGEPGR
jgi:FkbM family methyltransferase